MHSNSLQNLKILELASVLAGPAVGQFFAELGAEVLKIENPPYGDVTRQWRQAGETGAEGSSLYFAAANWGKKTLALDLQNPREHSTFLTLVSDADILVCNLKPGDAEKYGVAWEDLQPLNPRLIYGSISGYGEKNTRAGFDALIQAESGFLAMNGSPGGPHVKMPVAIVDLMAAHQLKEGLLLALLLREKSGRGQYVHVSLFDSAISSLANQATNYLGTRQNPGKMGSEHPNIFPYGSLFATADGKEVMLAIGNDRQFAILCKILTIPQIISDERFSKNSARVKNREELRPLLQNRIALISAEIFLDRCLKENIPAGAVRNLEDVFSDPSAQRLVLHDPQTAQYGIRQCAFTATDIAQQITLSPPSPLLPQKL